MRLQNDAKDHFFKNVLIVDDEPFILDIFSHFLCEKGCNVQAANSVLDAIQYLRMNQFDLILTDVYMKNSEFSDFMDYLNDPNERHASTPIIAVTGVPDIIEAKDRLRLSAVLEKPFTPDDLLTCIKSIHL